jgi:hypothetical protein
VATFCTMKKNSVASAVFSVRRHFLFSCQELFSVDTFGEVPLFAESLFLLSFSASSCFAESVKRENSGAVFSVYLG